MADIVPVYSELPVAIEDLSKFVLVGREKLLSVKAEIRAIDKVHLATEVRNQKREEARMLSEALLDAEVKLGELSKEIPKADYNRGNQYKAVESLIPSGGNLPKTKGTILQNLGFAKTQIYDFETLADNKDLVEQVKAEAREQDTLPTRARVLDLAQERKKKEQQNCTQSDEDINKSKKFAAEINDVLFDLSTLEIEDMALKKIISLLDRDMLTDYLNAIGEGIPKLLKLQKFFEGVMKQWD